MLEIHISPLFQYSFSVSQCHMSEMYIFQESLSLILRKNADFFDNYTSFSQIGGIKKILCHVHLERWVVIMGKNSRNGHH